MEPWPVLLSLLVIYPQHSAFSPTISAHLTSTIVLSSVTLSFDNRSLINIFSGISASLQLMASMPSDILLSLVRTIDLLVHDRRWFTAGVHTGINTSTGARPVRREIRDLYTDLPAFSLYIQALNNLMKTFESSLISYFQIAGKMLSAFVSWDFLLYLRASMPHRIGSIDICSDYSNDV